VATHNLAIGVVVGVFVASVMFVRRVAHLINVNREIVTENDVETARYTVEGQLLFASSNDLTTLFEYTGDPGRVVIDLTRSHIWDASTVAALDAIVTKYEQRDKSVEIVGMNQYTTAFHSRLSGGLGAGH
ncbi:MAG: SulP family inorganic anion transporter, partial [Leucobacter sp.]|nr:SulP family inorganic anion transporter [Leucobacter sp.]